MTKILFMGTPDFSATVLKGLISDERYEILAVVTQPDRAVGRKKRNPNDASKRSGFRSRLANLPAGETIWKSRTRRLIGFGSRRDCHSSLWAIFTKSIVRGYEVFCQRARFSSSQNTAVELLFIMPS